MDARLMELLDEVVRRTRTLQARRSMVAVWCLASTQLLIAGACMRFIPAALPGATTTCLMMAVVGLAFAYRSKRVSAGDRLDAARLVEATHPELKQRLLTLLDQQPDPATGQFNLLQRQLQHEVLSQSEAGNWTECVPSSSLQSSRRRTVVAMLTCVVLLSFLWLSGARQLVAVEGQQTKSDSQQLVANGPAVTVSVEPGSTEVERGSNVLVLARFDGPLPANVALVREDSDGNGVRIEMSKSLDDPVFGARIANVEKAFRYRIDFSEGQSETFDVAVFEYPKVERVDARIEFPAYTNLSPEEIPDTWLISAVEGATATLTCSLNKPIAEGRLVTEDGATSFPLELLKADAAAAVRATESSEAGVEQKAQSSRVPALARVRVPISKTMRLHFELKDDQGRENKEPGEFRITALANRPAEVVVSFPAKDMRVSPLEELQLEATVFDDFGVKDHGLILAVADREPVEISLGKETPAKQKTAIKHLVALELMKAEPDQLVSYFFYADDIAANGKPRRTSSDMFFAEVRHFEEIFRQGEQQPNGSAQQQQQQQGQNSPQANAAEKLAEQQKQIINATWKVIRRESGTELTATFTEDVKQILEGQQKAIEMLDQLAEMLSDAKSKAHADIAKKAMVTADSQLQVSLNGPEKAPLTPAMSAARAAYEALLKLRAREHQVQQQKSGGGQGQGSAGLAQQQLNQLELDQKKNRYEAERKANQQSPQAAQNKEQLQVLNRLRELSQRQSDVNQKLQEIEAALRAAKDEAAKEELQRQLKRLRDEQRDLLNNVDELRDRMDKPENQQQMAESRQKLEETRSQVRQASDALESGKLSQALNNGTRAERELQQLRDEFREKAAGQFNDSIKQLRQEARELSQKQDEIAQALQDPNAPRKEPGQEAGPQTGKPNAGQQADSAKSNSNPSAPASKDGAKPNEAGNTNSTTSKPNDSAKPDGSKNDPAMTAEGKPGEAKSPQKADAPKADGTPNKAAPRRSLRAPGDNRQQLAEDLKQQREQLDRVMENARQIVEQAETSEPVLAKELYETVRKSFTDRPGEALDVTRELLRRGLTKEAQQTEQIANQGLDHLQEGIEKASKLVLGDEVEALKRAREQVRQLKGSVAEEVAMNDPKKGKTAANEGERKGQQGAQQDGQPGDQKAKSAKDGDQPGQQASQQPGQGQAKDPKSGQQSGEKNGQANQQGGMPPGQQQGQQQGQQAGQQGAQSQQGQQPGQQSGKGQQQGGEKPGEQGAQSGSQPGKQGQSGQAGQQPMTGQQGGQEGSPMNSNSQSSSQQANGGARRPGGLRNNPNGRGGSTSPAAETSGGAEQEGRAGPANPITGQGFNEFSDQLREAEELVTDPKLRADIARVREMARSMRSDFKRHSKAPEWESVRLQVLQPLAEIERRIAEEIARQQSPDSLVPLDKDPVPDRYSELVRRYYERLSQGK